jgi:flagellar export protein FliJ
VQSRPFQFRLERVRALRERTEQRAAEELAASLAGRRRVEDEVDAAARRVAEAREERRGLAGATGADLLARQAYIERTQAAQQAAELSLGRHDADIDARRSALVVAARDHRALSRLKDRMRHEHGARAARLEGAAMDELGLAVYRRGAGL